MARILIVDDDIAFRAMLSALVQMDDHQAVEASDGVHALELLGAWEKDDPGLLPDLMIVDFSMARMGGYELILKVRQSDFTRNLPILMMTGTSKDIDDIVRQQGVHLLRKFCTNEEVIENIQAVLKGFPVPKRRRRAGAAPAPKEPDIGDLRASLLSGVHKDPEFGEAIKVVDLILRDAVARRASDIHLEHQEDAYCVRLRIDGVLHTVERLPPHLGPKVVSRIKVMSSMNPTERRLPQDGRYSLKTDQGLVEFRISTLPSQHGEKIVLRVLRHERVSASLDQIFVEERDLRCVREALSATTGLILVTGPTGSGKTTTLYTMLESLNTPTRNIITVEDPVESQIPGITQVPVKSNIGYTFERVLRACLRQDPNVIMVGEIRDTETAEMALKAAMTGHLVLSTLHTNTAPLAVHRLATMGVKLFLISAALRLVVAQRLVRLLCPKCKVQIQLSAEQACQLSAEERKRLGTIWKSAGCPECDSIGFKGRRAVLEVMPFKSFQMHDLLKDNVNPDLILKQAQAEGLLTLRSSALELIEQGLTSFDEGFSIYNSD
jgi:type IV pilus assembly protein PilB